MSKETYRIQVRVGRGWKTGLYDYTKEEAEDALNRLKNMGYRNCRIISTKELFN